MPLLPPELLGGSTPNPATPANPTPNKPKLADSWVWPIRAHVQTTDFLDQKYHSGEYGAAVKGFWHTGIDLNVLGTSGNGDVGMPVFAAANGRVECVAVRTAGGTWGPVVVISHTLPNGRVILTRCAHLQNVKVSIGDIVTKGQKIAEIGLPANWISNAASRFPGHLHFDVFHTRPAPPFSPMSYWPHRNGPQSEVTKYLQDPAAFLRAMKAGEPY